MKFRLKLTYEFDIPFDVWEREFGAADPVQMAAYYNGVDPLFLMQMASGGDITKWRLTALIDRGEAAMRLQALLLDAGAQVRDMITEGN